MKFINGKMKNIGKIFIILQDHFCDGYHWSIQLTFDNDSIFYIGGHCRHPDIYYSFARDVNDLFGKDVLRLEDCFVPDRIKYANLLK